ncbi:ferritin-like domain-containing protein [Chitinophaga caseinilytica]|uniref:Ferritin-like domain-containing protein n=1 Tax=Chitinophaga caseinilytica TaxID=2267521 RepID=A0ABZ2YWM6_9BACT
MAEKLNVPQEQEGHAMLSPKGQQRRRFLSLFAGTAAAATLMHACSNNDDPSPDNGVNLGGGDIGILNYAYALEQLEAAFYIRVTQTFFSGATATEQQFLTDIRDHEIAHREFFRNALGGKAIPTLEADFSKIDFNSRASVLGTAKAFEDLGVAAYNGAGKLITDGAYLLLAGKIVSVEARHAAMIRDLLSNGSFADSTAVDANGLDMALAPPDVLKVAGGFLKSKINASNLPTS